MYPRNATRFGDEAYAAGAKSLLARGASLIVITRGAKGVLAWHSKAGAVEVEAPAVEVVDTIGAGDSFHAALLFARREQGCLERVRLQAVSANELRARAVLCLRMRCNHLHPHRRGSAPRQRSAPSLVGLRTADSCVQLLLHVRSGPGVLQCRFTSPPMSPRFYRRWKWSMERQAQERRRQRAQAIGRRKIVQNESGVSTASPHSRSHKA